MFIFSLWIETHKLTLTIRLEAVEITPAERHVEQWVVLGVRDPTVPPIQWCVHVLWSPESTSLPASQTLKMQSMNTGKSRLQQNRALKNTWAEEEGGTVSDLSLRWPNSAATHPGRAPLRGKLVFQTQMQEIEYFHFSYYPSVHPKTFFCVASCWYSVQKWGFDLRESLISPSLFTYMHLWKDL